MSDMQKLCGMNDEELRLSIIDACKRHIPNIDLPSKYHVVVDGLPLIYGEGMVKGYEFGENKFKEHIIELERENAELNQQNTLLSGVFSREEELQSHITELKRIIADSLKQEPVAITECKEVHGHICQFLNRTRYGMDTLIDGDKLYASPIIKDTK